jgi:hypothetical protein
MDNQARKLEYDPVVSNILTVQYIRIQFPSVNLIKTRWILRYYILIFFRPTEIKHSCAFNVLIVSTTARHDR